MSQIIKQTCIREGHRWFLTCQLQVTHHILHICPMYEVYPFLNIFLMNKRIVLCTEESVEIKLTVLSLLSYLTYLVGHLISQHHHFGQG